MYVFITAAAFLKFGKHIEQLTVKIFYFRNCLHFLVENE